MVTIFCAEISTELRSQAFFFEESKQKGNDQEMINQIPIPILKTKKAKKQAHKFSSSSIFVSPVLGTTPESKTFTLYEQILSFKSGPLGRATSFREANRSNETCSFLDK